VNNKERKLLEEVIRENVKLELSLIKEVEFNDPLLKIFVQPFTDIIDTARAGLEKVSGAAWTHIGSLAKQAVSLAIPFLSTKTLDQIQQDAEQRIEKQLATVNQKYGPALKRNYDTMRDRDLWGVAFLLNPQLFLGIKTAMVAPEVALGALEALTGGHPAIVAMREKLQSLNQRTEPTGGWDTGGAGASGYDLGYWDLGFGDGGGMFENKKQPRMVSIYFEQHQQAPVQQQQQQPKQPLTKQQINQHLGQQVIAASKNPKIQQVMNNNPVTNEMKKIAVDSIMQTANVIAGLKTYEDYQRYFGEDFKKFEQELFKMIPEKPAPEQEQEFKKQFVPQIRQAVLNMYAQQVQMMAGKFPMIGKQLTDISNKIRSL
jgi:hypothetical protein